MGKDIVLKCDIPNVDRSTIVWKDFVYNNGYNPAVIYDGTRIDPQHAKKDFMEVDSNKDLTVKDVDLDSAGEYFCEATADGNPVKKTFDVVVGGECTIHEI